MASIVLKSIAEPTQASETSDVITPLNYHQWLRNNVSIIPDQAQQQYQTYLLNWYSNKNQVTAVQSNKLKEDYISLLKRVSVLFKDDPEFERFTKIDFDSRTELAIAIPFYARKLKEIALYFASKRQDIKNTKLQYNLVGSSGGLERILSEHLLKAFTKNKTWISKQDVYSAVPELSTVNRGFSLEVEELYDMHNYYEDSSYYDLSSSNPLLFVLEDYITNVYNTNDLTDVPLSGIANPLSRFVLCENQDQLNVQILSQLGQHRMGNDIYWLSGGYYAPEIIDVSMDLTTGENYFYWWGGEYRREIPEGKFVDKSINDIDWTNATGGSSVDVSDIIWTNVGNIKVEGAWLMDSDYQISNQVMSATMTDGRYFKFPYPGIGISAENIDWTGPQLSDITEPSRKFFPSESEFIDNQETIKDLYWSNYSSITAASPVLLQETTLYQGASAAKNYKNADKLIVRRNVGPDNIHDIQPNNVFQGDLEESWLFDFQQTEIPIKAGTNNVYYPLTSFDVSDNLFFIYDSGTTQSLSSIDIAAFAGAVAGQTLQDSDVLIKLNSVCGPEIEAAFLKGIPLSSYETDRDSCACDGDYTDYYTGWKFQSGSTQPALSFKVNAGEFVRFLWTGPKTDINKVIPGFKHDNACEYHKDQNKPSILDTNFLNSKKKEVYEKWKTCSCKTVNNSPLGHNGPTIDFYRVIPDFVAVDTAFPQKFSFNNWRGADGLNYKESSDLCWFRTTDQSEKDVSWSAGEWLDNNDQTFWLETGKTYWYWRSDLNRCGFELPYLVVNHCYTECQTSNCERLDCLPVWKKAVLDDNGNWVETAEISDMIMESGKFYSYKHLEKTDFTKNRLLYNNNFVTSATYISLSAVDPAISYQESTTSIPSLNFKIKIPLENTIPYWGKPYIEMGKNKYDFRLEHDYLQIKQPIPSDSEIGNNDVVEYQSPCGNCFIWQQPVEIRINNPIRQWNKILIDDCVRSDILNHLHTACNNGCQLQTAACYSDCQELDLCGCGDTCYNTKTGLTATTIPSDLIFNTELSGIPMFIDYVARSPYTLDFQVEDITDGGIYVPPVSSLFCEAVTPWKNLVNEWKPFAAVEAVDTELMTAEERGLFLPNNIGQTKWELHNAQTFVDTEGRDDTSTNLVRNTYDLDIKNIDSGWMKNYDLINPQKSQTYYPYTTEDHPIGLDQNFILDQSSIIQNDRGQSLLSCGPSAYYTTFDYVTGNVISYSQDIWGNQYFLVNPETTKTQLDNKTTFSDLWIKTIDGKLTKL